jgi:hypothetical protein
MNEQVQKVCEQIQADAALANGYNAIGFSQGGLFVCVHVLSKDGPEKLYDSFQAGTGPALPRSAYPKSGWTLWKIDCFNCAFSRFPLGDLNKEFLGILNTFWHPIIQYYTSFSP